jgi:hypothetical protein
MSKIINLPSGATATIRDPRTLKQKDRQKVLVSVNSENNSVAAAVSFTDSTIAVLVEEWSFDLLPPSVKLESLGELSIADYDALAEAANDGIQFLFPQLRQTAETEADPKATTANSKG